MAAATQQSATLEDVLGQEAPMEVLLLKVVGCYDLGFVFQWWWWWNATLVQKANATLQEELPSDILNLPPQDIMARVKMLQNEIKVDHFFLPLL